MKFYDYQQLIYNMTLEALEQGKKKILIQSAGGSGKTFMFTKLLEDYSEKHNKQSIFLTPRINLSEQTHKPHWGYYQGNRNKNLDRDLIIGNIQTFSKRPLNVDIVLFDECHMVDKMAGDIMNKNPDRIYIAISATPYKGNGDELDSFKDFHIIKHGIDENYLIEKSYLTSMKFYKTADTEEYEDDLVISKETGDFTDESLKALERKGLFNDIWESIQDKINRKNLINEGLLVVTHSQEQARIIYDDFKSRGFKVGLVISDNNKAKKDLASFSHRKLEAIITVDMVGTGTDIKHLTHVVLARAFANHALYRQVVYRGDRKSEGKNFFYVYDFGGNWDRLGNPFLHPEPTNGEKSSKNKKSKCECGSTEFNFDRFDDLEEGVRVTIRECLNCKAQSITTKKLEGIECDRCNLIMPLKTGKSTSQGFLFTCGCGNHKLIKKSVKKLELITEKRGEIVEWATQNILNRVKDREAKRDLEAFFLMSTLKNINFVKNAYNQNANIESKRKILIKARRAGTSLLNKTCEMFPYYCKREEVGEKVLNFINANEREKTINFTLKFLSIKKTPRKINKLLKDFS